MDQENDFKTAPKYLQDKKASPLSGKMAWQVYGMLARISAKVRPSGPTPTLKLADKLLLTSSLDPTRWRVCVFDEWRKGKPTGKLTWATYYAIPSTYQGTPPTFQWQAVKPLGDTFFPSIDGSYNYDPESNEQDGNTAFPHKMTSSLTIRVEDDAPDEQKAEFEWALANATARDYIDIAMSLLLDNGTERHLKDLAAAQIQDPKAPPLVNPYTGAQSPGVKTSFNSLTPDELFTFIDTQMEMNLAYRLRTGNRDVYCHTGVRSVVSKPKTLEDGTVEPRKERRYLQLQCNVIVRYFPTKGKPRISENERLCRESDPVDPVTRNVINGFLTATWLPGQVMPTGEVAKDAGNNQHFKYNRIKRVVKAWTQRKDGSEGWTVISPSVRMERGDMVAPVFANGRAYNSGGEKAVGSRCDELKQVTIFKRPWVAFTNEARGNPMDQFDDSIAGPPPSAGAQDGTSLSDAALDEMMSQFPIPQQQPPQQQQVWAQPPQQAAPQQPPQQPPQEQQQADHQQAPTHQVQGQGQGREQEWPQPPQQVVPAGGSPRRGFKRPYEPSVEPIIAAEEVAGMMYSDEDDE